MPPKKVDVELIDRSIPKFTLRFDPLKVYAPVGRPTKVRQLRTRIDNHLKASGRK
ncbi:hypothetical protein KIPB_016010, partial [Kipferlia bialata]|eukprot:g16010.t1